MYAEQQNSWHFCGTPFKGRSLSECCLPKCTLSFSLVETVLLVSSREDAAHPSALLVVVYTHF